MNSLEREPVARQGLERIRTGRLTGRLLGGRWRLGELLGQGGMSSVYAATHRNGKQVAIKVLRPDLSARERTKWRFLREGTIANRIAHDGIVTVLDDITENGLVFLVMELLEGVTVEQYCCEQGGVLPVGEVLAIADGVLDILIAAHRAGVVHRDIKPSNLFLTIQGTLKLLDFGIASLREAPGVAAATMNGSLLGTPGFMAPEQARGRWKEIDARTDLWEVGALMFRLLTGSFVHEAETTHEAVVIAATQPARSLASVDASLDAGLVALVDRAIQSDSGARWQTASEMQAAVQKERRKLPSSALPRLSRTTMVATLDEAMSVAGTTNEIPDRADHAPAGRTVRPFRWWPFLVYGALGAVVFLWIVAGRNERVAPVNPVIASTTDTAAHEDSPSSKTAPTEAAASVPSVGSPHAFPRTTMATKSPASANSASAALAPKKEVRSTKPLPAASGSTVPITTPLNPRRLEDVLNERR